MASLKQTLSRMNHLRKWKAVATRTAREVAQAAARDDAVAWADVQALLARLQPMTTGHALKRVGPDFDGGYLVPDDLEGLDAVFSPGVSDTLGFDLEMAAQVGACHLADASVEPPQGMTDNMTFEKKFLGAENAGEFITLDSWVRANSAPGDDLLLQMDIEGAEYAVLNAASDEVLERFRVILIEFHRFDRLFERAFFEEVRRAVERLERSHLICHVHTNNAGPHFVLHGREIPLYFEATYIRRDRVSVTPEPAPVPHRLDQPNVDIFPDLQTPAFWADAS